MRKRYDYVNQKKKGSTLLATILILTVLGVTYASLISRAMTERKINVRHEARLESVNAAESILEYGFAQLVTLFSTRTNLDTDALKFGSVDALTIPPSDYFGPRIVGSSLEIQGGTIDSTAGLTLMSANDPLNESDPMKGKYFFEKKVSLYAKATVTPPVGNNTITSYLKQRLQIRDSPIFTHAIFYNLDLDLHPGPKMTITGPVHTNGDLRLAPNDTLNFKGQVTTSQDLLHKRGHTTTNRTASIFFPNADGDPINMKNVHGGLLGTILGSLNLANTFLDSSLGDDFRAVASELWDGNLLTSQHDVQEHQPVYFSDYEPDDTSTSGYDPVNTAHDLIEPAVPSSTTGYKEAIEEQKMASKAGLYFKWDVDSGTLTARKKDGTPVGISALENSLWKYTENALTDRRRGQQIDILDIHTGVLKQLIENPGSLDTERIVDFDPSTDWNGVVYFECFNSAGNGSKDSSGDASAYSGGNNLNYSGVRLYGGSTATSATGEGVPSRDNGTGDVGVTFVTNNALYVKGNFNADGAINPSAYETAESGEVPVALMGDSVTFLSNNWNDATSKTTSTKQSADHTEIAAAVISGVMTNDLDSSGYPIVLNGGAHNFPRFLENWSTKKFALRGSIVCLYEPEVDRSNWEDSTYYTAPTRLYGYSSLFAGGTFPPGTPMLRTYKRISTQSLSKAEYESEINGISWPATP